LLVEPVADNAPDPVKTCLLSAELMLPCGYVGAMLARGGT
jgi:hypothetical protein